MLLQNLEELDDIVAEMLRIGRVPGAALAVVVGEDIVLAKGYGRCDVDAKLPMRPITRYPIASTTKAINATLLGMLVDEGRLGWDVPVQSYIPTFRLGDPFVGSQVTVRDLITMRTGLPRHDWVSIESCGSRAELVERLQYLELSCGFRERFQYNNLTVTAAGHVAERVTGRSWEELVREKLLEPLGMRATTCMRPVGHQVTNSYYYNGRQELLANRLLSAGMMAPSGGSLYSNVVDMARWISFNLGGGKAQGRQLVHSRTLSEIHSPQMVVGTDPSAPTPGAAYAMGWYVDTHNGCTRVSHGGDLHDVSSEVAIFPQHNVGFVSFSNLRAPTIARLLIQRAFDLLIDFPVGETMQERLAQYEKRIEEARERTRAIARVENTIPSHSLDDYAGVYTHPGYGQIEIQRDGEGLVLQRGSLVLPLQHWHFDAWVACESDNSLVRSGFTFNWTSQVLFEADAEGQIASVSIRLEPAVAPICFDKSP
jgi:CubicO group peptidase (beta-lactamase class C family)